MCLVFDLSGFHAGAQRAHKCFRGKISKNIWNLQIFFNKSLFQRLIILIKLIYGNSYNSLHSPFNKVGQSVAFSLGSLFLTPCSRLVILSLHQQMCIVLHSLHSRKTLHGAPRDINLFEFVTTPKHHTPHTRHTCRDSHRGQ